MRSFLKQFNLNSHHFRLIVFYWHNSRISSTNYRKCSFYRPYLATMWSKSSFLFYFRLNFLSPKMRTITFLWFWHICWDDERKWTIIFALMIPMIPLAIMSEINRFLNTKKLGYASVLLCAALTAWINEIILKPALGVAPQDNFCFAGCYAPSTYVAIGTAIVVIYVSRMIMYDPKDPLAIVAWSVATVCSFVAHPFLNYLSWTYDAISLVPGIVIGLVWVIICETKLFHKTLYYVGRIFKLENDITGENLKEENLVPS